MAADALQRHPSIPDNSHENARLRESYASFGSQGLTATANAHGHLLQITRYFGTEPSGFYCVDLPDTPTPDKKTERLQKLGSRYNDSNVGIRLEFEDSEASEIWSMNGKTPTMKFVHDRWPLFVTETPAFDVSIRYIIDGKTIYQKYSFKLKQGCQAPNIPSLSINANLLIRNLNFIGPDDDNKRTSTNEHYSYKLDNGCRIARIHKSLQIGSECRGAVGLIISPFINGNSRKIVGLESQNAEDRGRFKILAEQSDIDELHGDREITVTIAYTLALLGPGGIGVISQISAQNLSTAECRLDEGFEVLSFAAEEHLNFILRRNLEHILSVCSIPIGKSSEESNVPIALTCGDISGHQIVNAASFYAFEFLLSALEHLNKQASACPCAPTTTACETYKCQMRHRIRRICHGHLLWLYVASEEPRPEELQSILNSRYWATGKPIKSGNNIADLKGILNMYTPFNIIKAADFRRVAPDQDIREITDRFKSNVELWTQILDGNNKNHEYVFPHSMTETTHKFFFAEHATIWRALKSAEEMGIKPRVTIGQHDISYSSYDVHKSILQKFSCKSPNSQKRMIAVSRSPYEDRFRLRIQDTVILYFMDHGLFSMHGAIKNKHDVWWNRMDTWMNTLEYQMQIDENLNVAWDHPLQFALAMMISMKGEFTNPQLSADVCQYAKAVLLQSSSPNGLLSGQLNGNQEPELPKNTLEYDSYWHTTFEVPYILWKYAAHSQEVNGLAPGSTSNTISDSSTIVTESNFTQDPDIATRYLRNSESFVIDITNPIAKIDSCDEWLYSKREFFRLEADLSKLANEWFCKLHKSNKDGGLGIVINKAVGTTYLPFTVPQDQLEILNKLNKGYIVNIPKANRSLESITPEISYVFACHGLYGLDHSRYSPASHPKKFMHFYRMNMELALTCYRASIEADELSLFFDRHATYDKYFWEDSQLVFNKWTTELHISFYQVISDDLSAPNSIPDPKTITFPKFRKDDNSRSIGRVSMSLKFDGDFFDRCWTCYFVEYGYSPKYEGLKEQLVPRIKMPKLCGVQETIPWQERRVLEHLLLGKMLDEILNSTKRVLQEIKYSILNDSKSNNSKLKSTKTHTSKSNDMMKSETDHADILKAKSNIGDENDLRYSIEYDISMLLAEYGLFDRVHSDVFLSVNEIWHRFQNITDIVEEDLRENLETLELWMNRETKRQDRPPWSRGSQSIHGRKILQLLAANNRRFDEIRRCHDSIKSFNSSLTKRMEAARGDWELRGSDDIQRFTYITAFFLPIGFATSIFSMSGSPPGATLIHMITIAVAALGITLIALLYAKLLESSIARIARPVFDASSKLGSKIYKFLTWQSIYFLARYVYYPIRVKMSRKSLPQILPTLREEEGSGPISQARITFYKDSTLGIV